MHENEISAIILDSSIKIHQTLGPGLLESVYEEVLAYELSKRGLNVERQKSLPVIYEEVKMEVGFRLDLLVNDKVIVELKSVEKLHRLHFKTVTNYLNLSNKKLALLINFNVLLLKNGYHRIVNKL